eukprot:RCo019475
MPSTPHRKPPFLLSCSSHPVILGPLLHLRYPQRTPPLPLGCPVTNLLRRPSGNLPTAIPPPNGPAPALTPLPMSSRNPPTSPVTRPPPATHPPPPLALRKPRDLHFWGRTYRYLLAHLYYPSLKNLVRRGLWSAPLSVPRRCSALMWTVVSRHPLSLLHPPVQGVLRTFQGCVRLDWASPRPPRRCPRIRKPTGWVGPPREQTTLRCSLPNQRLRMGRSAQCCRPREPLPRHQRRAPQLSSPGRRRLGRGQFVKALEWLLSHRRLPGLLLWCTLLLKYRYVARLRRRRSMATTQQCSWSATRLSRGAHRATRSLGSTPHYVCLGPLAPDSASVRPMLLFLCALPHHFEGRPSLWLAVLFFPCL